MKITMPDDSDVFADFMQRVGDNGYMIGIDPVFAQTQKAVDIECAGIDSETGGILGYRVDNNGDRISTEVETFQGVDNITVY